MSHNPYHPFTVDIDALAKGMNDLIEEHPDGDCIILGMIPADLMTAFENSLAEKIPDVFHDPTAETLEDRIRDDGADLRRQITIAVTVAILRNSPKCIV